MSGATLADELEREEVQLRDPVGTPSPPKPTPSWSWIDWLKSEPGPGDVESYRQHPLNWDGTYEVAQILRGLTGLLGNLRLAMVDLVVGGLRLLSRRPPAGGGDGPVAGA